jgi:hypothetical protein
MGKIEKLVLFLSLASVLVAQNDKPPSITTVAAAGSVTKFGYTNPYFKLSILAPKATVKLNPLVDASGGRARLVQVLSDGKNWEDTYTFAVLADALANYHPPLESTTQYVRSVRHKLEKEGLSTVKEEFPITIAGTQFTGAILQEQTPDGRKYFRGMYSAFLNGYVLSFDVEASSEAKLAEMLAHMVVFPKH